jgi:hypothetical protein
MFYTPFTITTKMNKITRQYDENGMNIYGLHSIIKAIDGCKDAKGLNLYQFQNNS